MQEWKQEQNEKNEKKWEKEKMKEMKDVCHGRIRDRESISGIPEIQRKSIQELNEIEIDYD